MDAGMTDFYEAPPSASLPDEQPERSVGGTPSPSVHRRPYDRRMYLSERVLKVAYAGGWPRRLWELIPGALRVRRVEQDLSLRAARDGRPPLRIGFVSDLHLGPTTPPRLVENAFEELRQARLDVLALGGDYVFLGASPERMRRLEGLVASVPARTKVAVLGNHDFWARPERVVDALVRGGARVLVDQGLRLPPPHDDIGIIGLDDPLTSGHVFDEAAARAGARRALGSLPPGLPAVVAVAHSPDSLPGLRGTGVRMLLCGHTHGGQVALPGHRPLVMPSRVGRRYPFGVHHLEDGLTLFVSRGLGTSMIPLRTWAPEDLAVFTLR
jgi:predicted MPP superfamily phosphohydrolase